MEKRFLVCKVISQHCVGTKIKITDSIHIEPGGIYQYDMPQGAMQMVRFFWYVEDITNRPPYKMGERDSGYDNLKSFIAFWSLIHGDQMPINGFECGYEAPRGATDVPVLECDLSKVDKAFIVDPSMAHIYDWPDKFSLGDTFEQTFEQFMNADKETLDQCRLLVTGWSSCKVPNESLRIYDNYLLDISRLYYTIDALLPEDQCPGHTNCDACSKTDFRHSPNSRRLQVKQLLSAFPESDKLISIVMKAGSKRHLFVHRAKSESVPPTTIPTLDRGDGVLQRSASIDDAVSDFGVEGLATDQAKMILNAVVRALLINKVFPTVNFYPKQKSLHLAQIGG